MKALFPYLGGKHLLGKKIVSLFPEHTCYVEVFAGSAKVLFFKEESKSEVLNDINGELTNLYRIIKYHHDEFYNQLQWLLSSREEFARCMREVPETLTDIQRAVRYYYLAKTSFGGQVAKGGTFGITTERPSRINIYRVEQDLSDAHFRLANVTIESLNYSDLIKRYDRQHTLFYLDPPYWGGENDYGKNIFNRSDYLSLADILKGIKGKFILSINDVEEIREIFKDFYIQEVKTRYSVSTAGTKPVTELLIMNYQGNM